jgi:hypothetical protein
VCQHFPGGTFYRAGDFVNLELSSIFRGSKVMVSLHQTINELANNWEVNPNEQSRNFFRKISIEMKKWGDIEYPLSGEDEREIPNGSGGYITLRFDKSGKPDLNQILKLSNG